MVDKGVVTAKIGNINRCVGRLREKKNVRKNVFLKDKDVQDIVLHNLQIGIQGCIDIASHIVADEGWRMPATIGGIFNILAEKKVITGRLAAILKEMVGFRNIIVHEYEEIDLERVYDIFQNKLSDFDHYLKALVKFYNF